MHIATQLTTPLVILAAFAVSANAEPMTNWQLHGQDVTLEELASSAEEGDTEAQVNLGTTYAMGIGVNIDMEKALYWWKTAANQGVVKAQLTLGYRYGTGMGVEQNFTEAYHWLKMIDDEGDPSGAEQIAEFFEHGTGVPQSYSEAARWYRRAAEMGDGTSQWSLGEFYEKGTGVPKDLRQAKKWYSAAAAQGITNATLAVDRLANRGGARWEQVIEFKQGLAKVDAKDVRHVQYPDVTQPISYDPLRYKMLSYSEVWAKATDENGDVSWQSLFLFDCKGRMAILASSDFRANKRFDRSTTAQQMGAEVYMQPIGPDPIVEALEGRVCRKK